MERICPNCKENLGSAGDYFCYRCGKELPLELTSNEVAASRARISAPSFIIKEETIAKLPSPKVLAVIMVFCILIILALVLVPKLLSKKTQTLIKNATPIVLSQDDKVVSFDIPLASMTFGVSNLSQAVPSDADIYVETSDYSVVIKTFTKNGFASDRIRLNPLLAQANSFMAKDIALFSKVYEASDSANTLLSKRAWGLISKTKDPTLLKKLMSDSKQSSLSAGVFDGYGVVSNDTRVIKDVELAVNKTMLNLALNSKYAIAKNAMPQSGKMFVLVLSNSAYSYLEQLKADDTFFSDKFSTLIDILVKKGKNSYVIN